jgi:hypothetical protein
MAYFDNPERAARWERELAQLRAEKERRQASLPVMGRNAGISLAPPAIGARAAFGMARIAEPKTWSPPHRIPAPPTAARPPAKAFPAKTVKFALQPLPITFSELMSDAGLSAPVPPKSRAFAISPPESKPEPISFDTLMAEAVPTGMSLEPAKKPAPQPITFSQLKSEAAERRAI